MICIGRGNLVETLEIKPNMPPLPYHTLSRKSIRHASTQVNRPFNSKTGCVAF